MRLAIELNPGQLYLSRRSYEKFKKVHLKIHHLTNSTATFINVEQILTRFVFYTYLYFLREHFYPEIKCIAYIFTYRSLCHRE